MTLILEQDYSFVINNRLDFLALYGRTPLHAGHIVIIPNVKPLLQRELFQVVLDSIDQGDLVNTVIEVEYYGSEIRLRQYPLPIE